MQGLVMVEGDREGDDEISLLEHKHRKIWQFFSYTSKVVTTNNFETLTPWFYWIQNDMLAK